MGRSGCMDGRETRNVHGDHQCMAFPGRYSGVVCKVRNWGGVHTPSSFAIYVLEYPALAVLVEIDVMIHLLYDRPWLSCANTSTTGTHLLVH